MCHVVNPVMTAAMISKRCRPGRAFWVVAMGKYRPIDIVIISSTANADITEMPHFIMNVVIPGSLITVIVKLSGVTAVTSLQRD